MNIKDDDIVRMTGKAGGFDATPAFLKRFADLVAAHTLINIDPKSFMTWHEGCDAGVVKEREECAKICEKQASELYASRDTVDCAEYLAGQNRARSKA